ncbi:hypothetical protein FVF58_09470 [Paraburkholderia panacisoli]|uniref:Uncharacterized protein n=1 Tax=Paraburkholderia panacisoli TaxID=2603818 RepID=A0A5B0HCI9_9BURK|nr:hypothetical protein [Paraburkholderia panacisoli]KAA1013009.1 hypothetical protein FVF58_09470 [Paraburkholderia panacisoli]
MTYVAAYLLGVITFGVFMLMKLRHRTPAPTLYRRKNRDRLPEVVPIPVVDAGVGGIRYEHLGMTGFEE